MSELAPKPKPTISVPTPDDAEGYRHVQARGWLDAYPNDTAGVSRKWVEDLTDAWFTPEALDDSRARVASMLADDKCRFLYVAKVGDECVGMTYATNIDDNQRIEALYVDKPYYGTGLAQQLMETALGNLDLSQPIWLETITYNRRAQQFYQKYGFEIVEGSDHMYREIMPAIKMVRPGGSREI